MIKKIQLYSEQHHMLTPGDVIVAGVSGGADSVCLFFALLELQKKIPFTFSVAHINHGLREEAGEDEAFVRELSRQHGIFCRVFREDIGKLAADKRISCEEAGREFRYHSFRQALADASDNPAAPFRGKIAVAHHMEDSAETMLFNLFRGSGLAGLAGIRPVRDEIIRPLLCVSRNEIEEYLRTRKISFRTDNTNAEDIYTRNRIRHHIIPYAREINTGAVRHMAEFADLFRETDEYIGRQAGAAAALCVRLTPARAEIDLKKWVEQEPIIRKRILLTVLERLLPGRKDIGGTHIRALLALTDSPGRREADLPGGLTAHKSYDLLTIAPGKINRPLANTASAADMTDNSFILTDFESLRLPQLGILRIKVFPYDKSKIIPEKTYTKWFDYDKINSCALLRARKTGDYLVINQNGGRKTLKEYMIHEKIPAGLRDSMYVAADGPHIMWLPGYRISEYYKIGAETKTVLELELKIEGEKSEREKSKRKNRRIRIEGEKLEGENTDER